MRLNQFIGMLLLFVLLNSCSKFSRIQKSTDPIKKYNAAISYYEKKDYDKAVILLEDVVPLLIGKIEQEKAQFTLAYAYYNLKQYQMASYYFKRFFETFRRSELAEEAKFRYAYCLYLESPESNLDQSNTKQAIEAMQLFLNTFPESKRLEECNNIIKELRGKLELKAYEYAKLYYKTENYKAAITALGNFEKDFPDSDFIEEISFKKVEMAYQLAKRSVASKQLQRFNDAIAFYDEFASKYPQSTYIKDASQIRRDCVDMIAQITKLESSPTLPVQEGQAGEGAQ